ncbi:N-acyl-D-amino-acid deacylase family protein [Deinococcus marmoris]|uniref:UDP-glucose 4-epimerase n=1 Tax=Deinococcus marmoris TaxID=249408 RepID=A0A1U7P597_9DEIO|nr:D-aminoacylase [Deinococcus marmoris]OLV20339.1 UDP-glucose 4-epimerase [Deinococcus marmoris]
MSQILVKGGTVIDGTGAPGRMADVLIKDDRIVQISEPGSPAPDGAEVVDASGMVVAPGFIDVMSHSVSSLLSDGLSVGKVTQGVTTEIMGEGWTPAPAVPGEAHAFPVHGLPNGDESWIARARGWTRFGDWMAAQEDVGAAVNFGSFVGGATVRMAARGHAAGESTPEQIAEMRRVTREAMEDGAYGIATALIYPPGSYASTDELVAVSEEVGRANGIYITHMRSEGEAILDGFAEALEISERSGARLHLYHLKAAGTPSWPKMATLIERVNTERAAGKDIYADMYLYTAGGSGLAASCPPWASEDNKLKERLRDPETRAKIRAAMQEPDGTWEPLGGLAGPEGVYPIGLGLPEHADYRRKSLAEIAAMRGQDWIETIIELILAEPEGIGTLYHLMSEENIQLQLQESWVMLGSDAAGYDPGEEEGGFTGGHPRALGNFTRLLGRYVRELGILSLEEGVRRMTGLPAEHLHLTDRGELREGAYADLVVFDPETIGDRATYTESNRLSVGVRDVWVNGVQTLKGGKHTKALPGKRLYGPGAGRRE